MQMSCSAWHQKSSMCMQHTCPTATDAYKLPSILSACCCRYQHGTKQDKLYDKAKLLDVTAELDLGECGIQEVSFYHEHKNKVDFVFVDHPVYHRPGQQAAWLPNALAISTHGLLARSVEQLHCTDCTSSLF